MKIRSGFVSNSSSSSFVVLGTRMKGFELEDLGWYDKDEGDYTDKVPEGVVCYYDEHPDGYVVGIPLCETEDYGICNKELSEGDLKELMFQAAHKLNKPIRLMMGTRPT